MDHDDNSAPIRLYPGQALRLHAAPGTSLVVTGGCIRLEDSPLWLADCMMRQVTLLRDGEHHQFERGGWIVLHTEEGAGLVLAAPRRESRSAFLKRWLAAVRRWRLRFSRAAPSPHG